MARPVKAGLDYFPLDVYCDNKLKLIEAEFGLKGFAIVVKLWQKTYAERGYYCEFDEEAALLFADSVRMGGNAVSEIVRAAVKRGIFDAGMYEKYKILTSHGIQKRYMEGTGKRVRVEIEKRYLLLSAPEINQNVVLNGVSGGENAVSDAGNTQSKVNQTKLNQSIQNESETEHTDSSSPPAQKQSYGKYQNVLLTEEELSLLKQEFPSKWESMVENLSETLAIHGYRYQNHLAVLRKWAREAPDRFSAQEKSNCGYVKKNAFHNYVDTNPIDFDKLERLIDQQMDEEDQKYYSDALPIDEKEL